MMGGGSGHCQGILFFARGQRVLILQIKNQGICTLVPHISSLRVIIGIENMSVKKLKREIPPPPSPPPPPWSDLHSDILVCIMGRLCYVDQIHSGAVCKNWGLVSGVKPADKLPWVLTLNFYCKHDYYPITLYDPPSSITYELDHGQLYQGLANYKSVVQERTVGYF